MIISFVFLNFRFYSRKTRHVERISNGHQQWIDLGNSGWCMLLLLLLLVDVSGWTGYTEIFLLNKYFPPFFFQHSTLKRTVWRWEDGPTNKNKISNLPNVQLIVFLSMPKVLSVVVLWFLGHFSWKTLQHSFMFNNQFVGKKPYNIHRPLSNSFLWVLMFIHFALSLCLAYADSLAYIFLSFVTLFRVLISASLRFAGQ